MVSFFLTVCKDLRSFVSGITLLFSHLVLVEVLLCLLSYPFLKILSIRLV